MLYRIVLPLLGLALLLATAAFAGADGPLEPATGSHSYAKLVVTVSGPTDDPASYGWIWDDGERRNGVPWVVTSGTLGGNANSRAGKTANERIYWWITEKAWPNRVSPTEIEIMNAVGAQGWKLVECFEGAQHSYVPGDFSFTTARTYLFHQ